MTEGVLAEWQRYRRDELCSFARNGETGLVQHFFMHQHKADNDTCDVFQQQEGCA